VKLRNGIDPFSFELDHRLLMLFPLRRRRRMKLVM
jgi:hypothetical protein